MLKNTSNRMIQFSVDRIWLESADATRISREGHGTGSRFISTRDEMRHTLKIEGGNGYLPLGMTPPVLWRTSFSISYDNVPSLKLRTTEQVFEFALVSTDPPITRHTLLSRDER